MHMLCRLVIVAKHMTRVLFLVRFNNFDQTMSFYWSYTLLLKPPRSHALLLRTLTSMSMTNTVGGVLRIKLECFCFLYGKVERVRYAMLMFMRVKYPALPAFLYCKWHNAELEDRGWGYSDEAIQMRMNCLFYSETLLISILVIPW